MKTKLKNPTSQDVAKLAGVSQSAVSRRFTKRSSISNRMRLRVIEAAKQLGLINKRTGILQTHTIRYWETQFKQIKPTIKAGGRRYYSEKDIKIINFINLIICIFFLE